MSTERFGDSARIGLVGLGIMGAPIAQRVREKGHPVTAWNLEPERFELVRDDGVVWVDSPADVWAACDVAFVCVLGDPALEGVCLGERGFARGGKGARMLVDLSTSSPEATLRIARDFAAATGAGWVDAPMSGGPLAAREGNLTLMIGGEREACDAVMPLLSLIASNVTRMGDLGAGQTAKILNQAIVGVNYVLMAELLKTATAAGIDPALLPGALKGGMADSTIVQRIYTQMVAQDFDPPRSYARQLDKDLKSVLHFVHDLGLDLPVLETAIARYRGWAQDGNEMRDSASVSRAYGV
ncbi:MAG: NAD(P)-dependent oxidoreductase [Rhodobiaceae bacterium]|nr:NAD(P)-dependent oxidoreductase [Rhodobiaceae bacterium]